MHILRHGTKEMKTKVKRVSFSVVSDYLCEEVQ